MKYVIFIIGLLLFSCTEDTLNHKEIELCTEPWQASKNANSISIDGDIISITAGYLPTCDEVSFTLCWNGTFMESNPPQISAHFSAENEDNCQEFGQETIKFDLSPVKEQYMEVYPTGGETVVVNVGGRTGNYQF